MQTPSCYEKIVVIGTATIGADCVRILSEEKKLAPLITYIAYRPFPLFAGAATAQKYGVEYFACEDKNALTAWFCAVDVPTLIISAGNRYLFPREIVAKDNLRIVNYHDALLPAYPGQNAPTWAIFNGEDHIGVTWHAVDAGIDTGALYKQAVIPIGEHTTALMLVREAMKAGLACFEEILEPLLNGTLTGVPQQRIENRRVYRLAEVPDEGVLHIENELRYSYRFLRSIDYGAVALMPKAQLRFLGGQYRVLRYKLEAAAGEPDGVVFARSNQLRITQNGSALALRVEPVKAADASQAE
ncbi:MAG: formyltransferase family protein [Clostridia bacterium]|nr:formyltransferase family protein [Clostridia bacterium]